MYEYTMPVLVPNQKFANRATDGPSRMYLNRLQRNKEEEVFETGVGG